MDFGSILKGSREYTFHSHTQYCDGKAPMEEMARAALEQGFEFYGFSPHSPIPIASPCNMKESDVEPYLAEVERIRNLFAGRPIRFFAGMEIDYLGEDFGPSSDFFRSLPLDYSIGSSHFIVNQHGEPVDVDGSFDNFKRKMENLFNRDIDYVVETYFRHTLDMIERGGFDILGHFEKIGLNAGYYACGIEDGSHYQGLVNEVIDEIIKRGLTIELNTKAREKHGRFFPGERYLPKLVEAGTPILVNSDAHQPDKIRASRAEAFAILDSIANSVK
ncbi:MAG: histidinol-phosphatase [Muribaculaceae bacterium]|nr:histidinol-phosphatase [Muribaculaceae bacterium]